MRNPALLIPPDAVILDVPKTNRLDLSQGKFDDTSASDLQAAFKALETSKKPLLINFHAGVVDRTAGLRSAGAQIAQYEQHAYPLFVIWESGIDDILRHHLPEIFVETLFKRIIDFVKPRVESKVNDAVSRAAVISQSPAFGSGLFLESGSPVATSDEKLIATKAEQSELENAVRNDPIIQRECFLIGQSMTWPISTETLENETVRGLQSSTAVRTSPRTLMSPTVVGAISSESLEASLATSQTIVGVLGKIGTALSGLSRIALGAVDIFVRVLERFARKRDHGLICTIVEEVLREFYVANAGQAAWRLMKEHTTASFGADSSQFGGSALIENICSWISRGAPRQRIILVGHSAGANYINAFLRAINEPLKEVEGRVPVTFDVIFEAATCTFADFASLIDSDAHKRIGHIRTFGMEDSLEKADKLLAPVVPALKEIYPRSLLYLVSGLFEEDEVDIPLVGMQRFAEPGPWSRQAITTVQQIFGPQPPEPVQVLSKTSPTAPAGFQSGATPHGDFAHDPLIMNSIDFICQNGFG